MEFPSRDIFSEMAQSAYAAAGLDESPGFFRKAFNSASALVSHVADGMAKRSREEMETILETHCRPCPWFRGDHCGHRDCGCSVSAEERFFNKLAWRSERCPDDPPKW